MTTEDGADSGSSTSTPEPLERPRSIAPAGIVLGVGFGGFIDGILLHQLLQWHHMLTSTDTDRIGVPYYPADTVHGLEMNTVWDGLFHVFTWLMLLLGTAMLFDRVQGPVARAWRHRDLWSWLLVGWGVFNLVEGTVDHHLLGIHHVRSGPNQLAWDLGFLALGAALVAGGLLLRGRSSRHGRAARRGGQPPRTGRQSRVGPASE